MPDRRAHGVHGRLAAAREGCRSNDNAVDHAPILWLRRRWARLKGSGFSSCGGARSFGVRLDETVGSLSLLLPCRLLLLLLLLRLRVRRLARIDLLDLLLRFLAARIGSDRRVELIAEGGEFRAGR